MGFIEALQAKVLVYDVDCLWYSANQLGITNGKIAVWTINELPSVGAPFAEAVDLLAKIPRILPRVQRLG